MHKEFSQSQWGAPLAEAARRILEAATAEDVAGARDWTSCALVPEQAAGAADVAARERGVLAGIPAAALVCELHGLTFTPRTADGEPLEPGRLVAEIAGPARRLLTAERILLNFLGRLSGIATHTRKFVDAIAGTPAAIYDTRKTTPGWRLLEKYAVRCGGGRNHRTGLFDAVLIKDNHLAYSAQGAGPADTPAEAVEAARRYLIAELGEEQAAAMIVEVEVDTLEQLRNVLTAGPDIVLLDNMPPAVLRQAVALRNDLAPRVELEASGGISLNTVRAVAETGVERISCGALTHSAVNFDLGLDWV